MSFVLFSQTIEQKRFCIPIKTSKLVKIISRYVLKVLLGMFRFNLDVVKAKGYVMRKCFGMID